MPSPPPILSRPVDDIVNEIFFDIDQDVEVVECDPEPDEYEIIDDDCELQFKSVPPYARILTYRRDLGLSELEGEDETYSWQLEAGVTHEPHAVEQDDSELAEETPDGPKERKRHKTAGPYDFWMTSEGNYMIRDGIWHPRTLAAKSRARTFPIPRQGSNPVKRKRNALPSPVIG